MSDLVIVDSDVWSEGFRKVPGEPSPQVLMLRQLVTQGRVQLLGCIRQEVLQGLKTPTVFERIREQLRAFPDLPLKEQDYERAAEFFNLCRSKGVQGSSSDFLICACSVAYGLPILTKDKDFDLYAQQLPLKLVKA
ncbi:PIN domain-containing protein [Deinococcus sp.]|uniref:type II toxin-antitoxin system VapC family toxin n=1 Tax=Deinococcus sp. TaxID=47478 RepID=UPI0025BDCA9C|nr:PIN domain-containing protein [Deinococcus sp.]